jgi:predicted alpha-1,2-mannosidase
MRARRLLLLAVVTAAAAAGAVPARADLAADVDPMIGTFAPGFVFPGAAVPFGMVQNSPDTRGPFAYSGYLWSDPQIQGFSLVHLSGPGVKKGGDLPFMPTVGPVHEDPQLHGSPFTHAREHAEPGFYRVTLDATQTEVELTASTRAAMQRYTFVPSTEAKVVMDTGRSVEGMAAQAEWRVTGPDEVTGFRRGRYPVFFVARFSRPFESSGAFASGKGGWVGFDTTRERTVTMRAGISFVDEEGARRNLEAEAPDFDFDGMRARARAAWNRELARVQVEGGTPLDRRALGTALYHSFLHPNVFEDVDGRYRGADDRAHQSGARTHYANFSSWDTYKSQNQLFALVQPERLRDMLLSLLDVAEKGGRLPRWGEHSIDASHMSGDPVLPMIADGVCRGLVAREDARRLYDAGVGLRSFRPAELDALGYLPGRPGTTLEYGVADFALALVADVLGRREDAERWRAASLNYRNILDPETGWIRPRNADGSWHTPFDPTDETGFQEGNSWQYSWLAPHDAAGLFARMGGLPVVHERFERFFGAPSEVANRVTGFGVVYRSPWYAPGNEHDLQAPWMPSFAGRPWQSAEALRNARTVFRAEPGGLPGNDDLGGLSAWHVLNALGFGPSTPGAPFQVVGSPQFDRAVLELPRGRRFTIESPGAPLLPYVQSARLDGAPLERSFFADRDLRDGGTLELTMGARRPAWATGPEAAPPSASTHDLAAFGCDGR